MRIKHRALYPTWQAQLAFMFSRNYFCAGNAAAEYASSTSSEAACFLSYTTVKSINSLAVNNFCAVSDPQRTDCLPKWNLICSYWILVTETWYLSVLWASAVCSILKVIFFIVAPSLSKIRKSSSLLLMCKFGTHFFFHQCVLHTL